MKKKDIILILCMILLAAVLLLVGLSARHSSDNNTKPTTASESEESREEEPESSTEPADRYSENVRAAAAEYFSKNPAESYLLIRTNQSASVPIPLNEDYSFTVSQPDGSENVIHVGVNSFYMESSNCDNQNCVQEGTVTLENMNQRVLFNMVLCLPHQLSLEMLTASEAETALLEMLAQQEAVRSMLEVPSEGNSQNDASETAAGSEEQ